MTSRRTTASGCCNIPMRPEIKPRFGSGQTRVRFFDLLYDRNDRVGGRVSRFVRGWIFVAALGQAVLPGVVSVIDAEAAGDAVEAAARPHAEDHGTPRCPRVHQEDNCALCQFVAGTLATSADRSPSPFPRAKSLHVVRRLPLFPEWLADGAPSLPRAPPAQA